MEKSLDILWEKVQGMQMALDLQAKEYERRLTALNGEGERIKEVLKQSVPREVFDNAMASLDQKNEARYKELAAKVDIITAWQLAQQGTEKGTTQYRDKFDKFIPWIFSFATLIMMYLIYVNSKK